MSDDLFTWAAANAVPATTDQEPAPAEPEARDHDARWAAFVVERPDVAARVLAYCQGERDRGEGRIGMAKCWEALRGSIGAGKCMDNSLRAPAARWVVAQDPSLAGLIEMRRRKGST